MFCGKALVVDSLLAVLTTDAAKLNCNRSARAFYILVHFFAVPLQNNNVK